MSAMYKNSRGIFVPCPSCWRSIGNFGMSAPEYREEMDRETRELAAFMCRRPTVAREVLGKIKGVDLLP